MSEQKSKVQDATNSFKKIWKNYFETTSPDFRQDFAIVGNIFDLAFYDIFDDKFMRSWIKTPIFLFNTTFIITTFISSLLTVPIFLKDLKLLMSLSFALMLGCQVMTRMPVLLLYRKKWRLLKELILEEENLTEPEKQIVIGIKKLYRQFTFAMYLLYIMTVSSFITFNFASSYEFAMPLSIQFIGTSFFSHPDYSINCVVSVYIFLMFLCIIGCFDVLFCLISVTIIAKMFVCKPYFEKIGDFSSEYDTPEKQTELITRCVTMHQKILNLIALSSELFDASGLMQLLTSLGFYCFTVLYTKIVGINASIMLLMSELVETLLFCYVGELVKTQGIEIYETLWCSKWYEISNLGDRKRILFMLMNTQRFTGFTAGKVTRLGLEIYMDVLKTSMSFFTAVNSFM